MYALPIGQIRLTVLDDGTWPFPARSFFHNVPEAVWRRHVSTDAHGKIPVSHNYAVVQDARELIVIDTGYGDDTHDGRTGHLLAELARAGYQREDVTIVVNTHAHGDHIKRNTLVENGRRRPTFPRARYYLGRADYDWFGGARGDVHEFESHIGTIERLGQLTLVDDELALTDEVSLLPTPGHTPGHLSVVIMSEGRTAIYLGDVCHHPLHFAHLDWVSEFDAQPALTPASRAQLLGFAAGCGALLICPHAPSPGVGRLTRTSEGFQWQPANRSFSE
ncbi:MAG: MBL fold metallo-hydrolase [Sulfurifustis sp.]